MIKAIFFDMDGVLVDSYNAWYILFNRALTHFNGRTISMDEFNDKVWATDFERTKKQFFPNNKAEVDQYLDTQYPPILKEVSEMNGVKAALQRLSNVKKVVVTNSKSTIASDMLTSVGLISYFDGIYGADQARAKPAPDLILLAMKEHHLNKEEIIFIGDTSWDQEAASRAGVAFLGYKMDTPKSIQNFAELTNDMF